MGKVSGKKRRARKTYKYDVNRRRQWNKARKLPRINCPDLKAGWEEKRLLQNMNDMGLSIDPNQTFKIPSTLEILRRPARFNGVNKATPKSELPPPPKKHIVDAMEARVKERRPTTFAVSKDVARFAQYMIDKYKDNYEAMARDSKNYYQLSPKQIKSRIESYSTSQYVAALWALHREEKKNEVENPNLVPLGENKMLKDCSNKEDVDMESAIN